MRARIGRAPGQAFVTDEACVASAPGKIVLSGEYAVLDGAPAICMAIDRRARARVSDLDGVESSVTAAGFSDEIGRFEASHEAIQWKSGSKDFTLIDAIFRVLDEKSAVAIDLNSNEFIDADSGTKIGIGSSAAVTVALCAAIRQTRDVATLAHRAHALLQDGVGSGVDIACSIHGGLIEYQVAGASVAVLSWPKRLRFRVIWTGIAVSTSDRLAELGDNASKPSRQRLVKAAERIASAWRDGNTATILSGYGGYIECLHEFSDDHELNIFGGGHDALCEAAMAENLVYKPCGAGGGDVGILFGTDDALLDEFTGNLASGVSVLACRMDTDGLRFEGRTPA